MNYTSQFYNGDEQSTLLEKMGTGTAVIEEEGISIFCTYNRQLSPKLFLTLTNVHRVPA